MSEEELKDIEELIDRKILLAEVTGGLTSSDIKFIKLWKYASELQQKVNQIETNRDELLKHCHKRLGFLENCVGGDEKITLTQINVHREYLEILERG